MTRSCFLFVLLNFPAWIAAYYWLLIPERSGVIQVNPKYVTNAKIFVRRYGRGQRYVAESDGTIFHTWGDNVTIKFVFYEYLHNEYRLSFVDVEYKLCQFYKLVLPFIGPLLKNFTCPVPPGRHPFYNISFENSLEHLNLPYKFPFEKGKVELYFMLTETREILVGFYTCGTIQNLATRTKMKSIN